MSTFQPYKKAATKHLKTLPEAPGIYKMLDRNGAPIYIGKAKNIKQRVSTYFQKDYSHSTRTKKLVENIADIGFIQTDSDLEAIVLENTLIKECRPKYNILMKDDKSYVYIKVDLNEDFPKIRVIREHEMMRDKKMPNVRYFGPKLATAKVHETLRILKKIFPFRHCQLDIAWLAEKNGEKNENLAISPNKNFVEVKKRVIDYPCLDYSIKRCPGPCIGAISPVEYKKIVQQILDFLSGKNEEVEKSLKQQMAEAAEKKLFEKAVRFRDKLFAIQSITEKQKIAEQGRPDTDVVNFSADAGRIYFNILIIRNGKLINQENFILDALELKETAKDAQEILESFLTQYYEKTSDIPKEILIPEALENAGMLEKWLTDQRGEKVAILNPQRGEKNRLLELSLKNAVSFSKQYKIKWMAQQQSQNAANELAEILRLKNTKLRRIEGFDISHLGGTDTVGGMVVFENGTPKPQDYRHFKIRTITGKPDDYACMEEVLMRRLKYLQKKADFRFAKARKKDVEIIKNWGTQLKWKELMKKPDFKNFYLLWDKKKPIGMARLIETKQGIFMIEAIYILPKYRGGKLSYTFMEKLISRIKNKKARLYIGVEDHLLNHWLDFGFMQVRSAPSVVIKRNNYFGKLDGTHYTTLAYYRAQKKETDTSFSTIPDLIVIDGGKGQLGTANLVLKRLKIDVPVISLAKRLEEIYIPGQSAPILLEEGDEALKLLQRIRDESHRFAITFSRELHRKGLILQ